MTSAGTRGVTPKASRIPPKAAAAKPPAVEAPASSIVEETTRSDSFKCPSCLRKGCPAKGGSKDRGKPGRSRRVRYRRCRHCGFSFRTVRTRGGEEVPEILNHPDVPKPA